MRLVKGRGNFPCTLNGLTAADGACQSSKGMTCDSPYYAMRDDAKRSRRVVANYAVYLNELVFTRGFLGQDETHPLLVVCDEAHRLLDQLTQFETVQLTTKAADKLGLAYPSRGWDTIEDAIAWCTENRKVVQEHMSASLTSGTKEARDWVAMARTIRSWRGLTNAYLPLETGETIKAAPLWPTRTARKLFDSAEHFLLMSATLYGGHLLAELIGLDPAEYEYYASPSPFDPRRWPVHVRPVASLSYRAGNEEWERMAQEIHRYMHEYKNTRGIIHVTAAKSLNRPLHVIDGCESCAPRLLRPRGTDAGRGKRRADLLSQFRRAGPDAWLAHYSVGEGESFDDDSARIQLITKVPYPDLSDVLTKLRSEDSGVGRKLYAAMTLAKIGQTAGRVMRHEKDYGETIILDGNFLRLWKWNKDLAPGWLKDVLVW
ncbi:MAG: hypothetical protein IIB38_04460 [Candidatus Hydrogenedentes bacterium]|nr:hypothetical protein [Candidatus Hydrogenedentota bacterium]